MFSESEDQKLNEGLKEEVIKLIPENPAVRSYNFRCQPLKNNLLAVEIYLGTQSILMTPSFMIPSIKKAAKNLGFIDAEIVYADTNITNYDEPERRPRIPEGYNPFDNKTEEERANDRYGDNRF